MRSVFLLSLSNLKKKKLQNALIALTIFVSAFMFCTSIGVLGVMNKPFEAVHEKLDASHTYLYFDTRIHNAEDVRSWWASQKGVMCEKTMPAVEVSKNIRYKGEDVSNGAHITEMPAGDFSQDRVSIVNGEDKPYPGPGEVWIPTGFANKNGIKVNDLLSIPAGNGNIDMKVTAVVIDPQFSASIINPVRFWVSPGELSYLFPFGSLNTVSVGVRFTEYDSERESELWKKFNSSLKTPFSGTRVTYDAFASTYTIIQQLSGALLLAFSIIIVIIMLIVIWLTISGAVIADYKIIGILKAQGFSSGNVITAYSAQYLLLAVASVIPGILLSRVGASAILKSFESTLGPAGTGLSLLLPGCITFLVLVSIIVVSAVLASRKAGGIKPALAIRHGAPVKKYSRTGSISLPVLKGLPVPMLLGLKQTLENKRQSLFLLATVTAAAFVCVFSLNLVNSVMGLSTQGGFWGFDDSPVTLARSSVRFQISHDALIKRLQKDDRIENIVPRASIANASVADEKKGEAISVMGTVLDGDMDCIGVMNLEGRNPVEENEIGISVRVSERCSKKIGDLIDVYMEGRKTSYLVTGIFQTTNYSGMTFRLQMSALRSLNPTFEPSEYSLDLKPGVDVEEFVHEYKQKYGETLSVTNAYEAVERNFKGVATQIAIPMLMLCTIFALVAFIIIFNITMININSQKKNYGIYKAGGMTPGQIRMSIVLRIELLTAAALLTGIPLGILLPPGFLAALLSFLGIVRFPMTVSMTGIIAIIPVCMLITGVSAWIPSGRILTISPRNLINE